MVALKIPLTVRYLADNIKSSQENWSYAALLTWISYFMLNQKSISALVRNAPYTLSVSATATAASKYQPDRLVRRIRFSILKKFGHIDPGKFALIVDDTKNPKYGRQFSVGHWGSSSGIYRGQRIVVVALVHLETKRKWPIGYSISEKGSDKSALDEALEIIEEILSFGFPPMYVVADSWFSSADFAIKIKKLGCQFVGELKHNRKARKNPGPHVPHEDLASVFSEVSRRKVLTDWDSRKIKSKKKRRKTIAETHLQLNGCKKMFKAIAVFNNRRHRHAFAYYISTDLQISGAKIWMLSRARWSIECIFRTCKQNLSFGRMANDSKEASYLAVEMPFYIYCQIQSNPEKFGGTQSCSVDRILARIRSTAVSDSIDALTAKIPPKNLNKLKARRCKSRSSLKPVDSIAAVA